MKRIGRKIYYDLSTGNVIFDTGERAGEVIETTTEDDFNSYVILKERAPDTVGFTHLEYGAYQDDFNVGGFITRIDLTTLKPLFTYPEEVEEPSVDVQPLSEKVAFLESNNEQLNTDLGNLLLQSALDTATITELSETVGGLLFEVAELKGGYCVMWYATIKRFYDNGHPAYTNESMKTFVLAKMITADQYKEITNVEYEQ